MYCENIGKKFGKWTVLSLIKFKNRSHYICQCECGNKSRITAYHVTRNLTNQCKICAVIKHGQSSRAKKLATRTYQTWNGARNRCNNINNKDYIHYGARGIKMCERWNIFENFVIDMGEKPKGLTLDRIDNNGNYEPGNCRWATYSQQNSNQRRRKLKSN